jgi:hypothetical protein
MSNPWLKKNPFMSMWLSGANRMAGMMRSQARRQINTALTQASRDILEAAAPKSTRAKPKRRR